MGGFLWKSLWKEFFGTLEEWRFISKVYAIVWLLIEISELLVGKSISDDMEHTITIIVVIIRYLVFIIQNKKCQENI